MRALLYDWAGLNAALSQAIEAAAPEALRPVLLAVSAMTGFAAAPVYVAALYWWSRSLPAGVPTDVARARRHARAAWLLALVVAGALTIALKTALGYPRPWAGADLIGLVPGAPGADALPSGHGVFTATLAAALWPVASARGRLGLVALVGVAGLVRVALGEHHAADVVWGWALGMTTALLAWQVVRTARTRPAVRTALLLAIGVLVADLLTKVAIVRTLPYAAQVPLTGFFDLVHWGNPGAAFGMLSTAGGWQRWLFLGVAIAASVWLLQVIYSGPAKPIERLGCGAVLGGALANAFDRAVRGRVVDWLDFHIAGWHWPAFNLADVGITLGAVALVLSAMRTQPAPLPARTQAPAVPEKLQ